MNNLPETKKEKSKLLPDYGEVIGTHDEKLKWIPSPVDVPVETLPKKEPLPKVPLTKE